MTWPAAVNGKGAIGQYAQTGGRGRQVRGGVTVVGERRDPLLPDRGRVDQQLVQAEATVEVPSILLRLADQAETLPRAASVHRVDLSGLCAVGCAVACRLAQR